MCEKLQVVDCCWLASKFKLEKQILIKAKLLHNTDQKLNVMILMPRRFHLFAWVVNHLMWSQSANQIKDKHTGKKEQQLEKKSESEKNNFTWACS